MPVLWPVIASNEQSKILLLGQPCRVSPLPLCRRIALLKEAQVVLLPVNIMSDGFQPIPGECLAHGVQIVAQRIQDPDKRAQDTFDYIVDRGPGCCTTSPGIRVQLEIWILHVIAARQIRLWLTPDLFRLRRVT